MKPIPIASILINIFLFVHSNTCYKPIKEIQVDESSRLNMTVFIESKCKFSKKFIQEQLQPIYDEIKDKINIKFVTFALSETHLNDEGEVEIKCLHGPAECELDLIQACSLFVHRQNHTLQAEIIFCTMRPGSTYLDCLSNLQLNQPEIDKCKDDKLGLFLTLSSQREAGYVMNTLQGVPAVIFNNMVDPVVAEYSLTDLKNVTKRRMFLYYKELLKDDINQPSGSE